MINVFSLQFLDFIYFSRRTLNTMTKILLLFTPFFFVKIFTLLLWTTKSFYKRYILSTHNKSIRKVSTIILIVCVIFVFIFILKTKFLLIIKISFRVMRQYTWANLQTSHPFSLSLKMLHTQFPFFLNFPFG